MLSSVELLMPGEAGSRSLGSMGASVAASASDTAGRTFDSVCDVCLRDVPGHMERHGQDVFLVRTCPQHGERRFLTSRNGTAFERFDRVYHALFPDEAPPHPPANS
jgi:hypothetical protein